MHFLNINHTRGYKTTQIYFIDHKRCIPEMRIERYDGFLLSCGYTFSVCDYFSVFKMCY